MDPQAMDEQKEASSVKNAGEAISPPAPAADPIAMLQQQPGLPFSSHSLREQLAA